MTLLVCRIYAMRTYEPKTLLRQHISNIERLYDKTIYKTVYTIKQYSTATLQ